MVKFQHLRFHAVIFIFCFSDRWSLKTENENNSTKNLTAEAPYIHVGLDPLSSVYKYRHLHWLA